MRFVALVILMLAVRPISLLNAAECLGDRESVSSAKRMNVQQSGSVVAIQIFGDLALQHLGAFVAYDLCRVREFALAQGARKDRHRRLGLLIRVGHHAYRMKAQRVGEDVRAAARLRKKRRKHRAVESGEFFADRLGVLILIECGMEHEIVVGGVPRNPQRMSRQNDETDGSPGQRLNFHSVGQGERWLADLQKFRPSAQIVLDASKYGGLIIVYLTDSAAVAESFCYAAAGRHRMIP